MAITMQGAWTVTVKSKNADFAQQYVVAGASSSNNGAHPGTVGATQFVTGAQWSINIQSQAPAQPWRDSVQRITFPTVSGGVVQFDIRSNDSGGDGDYNDLVLTCSMPVSAAEFVVYGNVKTYAGRCLFNPCHRWYVIDKYPAFLEALKVPSIRSLIETLYPERIPRRVGPIPDPPPDFKPIVIPNGTDIGNVGYIFQSTKLKLSERELAAAASEKDFQANAVAQLKGTAVAATLDGAPVAAGFAALKRSDLVAAAKIRDNISIFKFCDSDPAPGLLLSFQEYDRTESEKLGEPYTGSGNRQNLGLAATDEQGNYIFRFSMSLDDIAAEVTDVAPGELVSAQIFPDVIVQALGTGTVDYESVPYYNIPNLMRIDLCLPRDRVHPTQGCSGDRVIQRVGDVIVLNSALNGNPNRLDSDGRITCRNVNAPQVDCAAWRGALRLYSCFGAPAVTSYTVRYMRAGIDVDWQFVSEDFLLNHIPDFGPGYPGTLVGPTLRNVKVDGGAATSRPTYTNHEGDSNWIENDLKLILNTSRYRPADNPGSVDFRIQGYDAAGNVVPGKTDTIRLYVDNRATTGDIASISMGTTEVEDCAHFVLTSDNAPLTVRYRVVDVEGFVQDWGLSVTRGNNHPVAVSFSGVMPKSYVMPTPPLACSPFHGTPDEATADASGYVTTTVQPTSGGWLPPGQQFCAFAFTLTAHDRVTDGRTAYPLAVFWQDLIGLSAPVPTP